MSKVASNWIPLVWTGARFSDFQPYVPAIDDSGAVVFEAALVAGGTGVFLWREGSIETLFIPEDGVEIVSHPDRNAAGDCCVYVRRADGSSAIAGSQKGRPIVYADTREGVLSEIGPLGPVMDKAGTVGFRATLPDGSAAVCVWQHGEIRVLAVVGRDFSGFYGLPVIARDAGTVFRADRPHATQGVYRVVDGQISAVFEMAAEKGDVARFPAMSDAGEVACGWMVTASGAHVLRIAVDGTVSEVDTGDLRFGSLRGCLLGEGGELCFTGTPQEGRLGVFRVRPGGVECLLAEGDMFEGARVEGFALNPVSINAQGMLVARILLADSRQVIAVCA